MTPILIYCAGGNRRFAGLAIAAGFHYGEQLPDTIYFPLYFADQDWRNPDRKRYMSALAKHRPEMATVLDWEQWEQRDEVLNWAEDAAQYVNQILIVPKVPGGIDTLPRRIGGKDVLLAYSVPTKFAGTSVPAWEFMGWPVHLLGGSPHKQIEISHYLNVVSVDGNMMQKVAIRWCGFWVPGTARGAKNRYWPKLEEAGIRREHDAPYEAFRRSCKNIMAEWKLRS